MPEKRDDHHPNCYQNTGVPVDMPAGVCDCRVLKMIDDHAMSTARNGRPAHTHFRRCHQTPEDAQLHQDHSESVCSDCGCCWGCDLDCCSEYFCPNQDCGCSAKFRSHQLI